ncbi:MAG: hypothetical protein DI537_32890 [Stutzerimonas stutzeri]|nr:MAG: hypothetical protein DI537_32890 [Stutzerimonas stutzeri]
MTVLSERAVQARKAYTCYHCVGQILPGTLHLAANWLNDGCFETARMHFECSEAWTDRNWGSHASALAPADHARPLRFDLTAEDRRWLETNHPLAARNLTGLTLNADVVWC